MGAIINAGIKRVVCFEDEVDHDDLAEVLAEHAGIAITRLPKPEAVKGQGAQAAPPELTEFR